MMKRLLALTLTVLLAAFLVVPTNALAAEEPADGAEATLTTKKDTYAEGEDLQLTLTVRNGYDHPIENLWAAVSGEEFNLLSETSLPRGETLNAGETKTYRFTLTTDTRNGNDRILDILPIVLMIVAAAAVIAAIVWLILRKKKVAKAAVSMLLVCAMVTGFFAMPLQAQAAGPQRQQLTPSLEVTVGDVKKTISLHLTFDHDPNASGLQLDLQQMGYREDLDAFVVSEEFSTLTGTLKDAKNFSSIKLEVYDRADHLLSSQTVAAAERFYFSPVGLLPGINHIRLTATGSSILTLELKLYDPYLLHYPQLEGADTDTDGDGIFDLLENSLGLDSANTDTDGDGISDYEELSVTLTDPTKADSDGNGLADGEDDPDGDGMPIREELQHGLSTVLEDTDRDGISDADELRIYGTDPLKGDTDGDGAEDGWELEHNYSPYAPNATFNLSCETSGVSEAFPVSASATLTVSGAEADVTSLEAVRVSAADSPYLSQSIAGYLGEAVDFTLDGTFESATLTFHYDTSLGTIGPDFQPRIYYLNEVTGELEELPNQTVYNGTVIAQTSHFSRYLLLNDVLYAQAFASGYDALEECYSTAPGEKEAVLGQLGSADIVMAMDRSASMAWSDPNSKSLEVARYFVDHIRGGYDSAALLTYTRSTETLCGLTTDTQALHNAIDRVTPDNGVQSDSGTDGASALMDAVSMLETGMGSYRYVLFFSDGDDPSLQQRLPELVSYANSRRVQLLCVGINTMPSSVLAELADKTDGKYITLTDTTVVEESFKDALEVFDAITYSDVDSNNDGISDYVTKLICDGKLPLQNGSFSLFGVDFSVNAEGKPSNDWDGDGLTNGQELRLVVHDGKAYMKMRTDPTLVDTDLDGFTDKEEKDLGMNPIVYSVQVEPLEVIMGTTMLYVQEVHQYDPNFLPSELQFLAVLRDISQDLLALLIAGGSENRKEVYWKTMAEFFSANSQQLLMQDAEKKILLNGALNLVDAGLKHIHFEEKLSASKDVDTTNSLLRTARDLHYEKWKRTQPGLELDSLKDLYYARLPSILGNSVKKMNLSWLSPESVDKAADYIKSKGDAIGSSLKDMDDFNKIIGGISTAADLADTAKAFARIEANCQVFLANHGVLDRIINEGADEYAIYAAQTLSTQVCDEMGAQLVAIENVVREAGQAARDPIVSAIGSVLDELLPSTGTGTSAGTFFAVAQMSLAMADLLTSGSKKLESTYKLLTYHALAQAYQSLFWEIPKNEEDWVDFTADSEKLTGWLCSIFGMAQAHICGEKQYVQHYKLLTGILSVFDKDEVAAFVNRNVEQFNKASDAIRQQEPFKTSPDHGGGG